MESQFENTFLHMIGAHSSMSEHAHALKASCIDTPLGPMLAIADDQALYLLEFMDWKGLDKALDRLKRRTRLLIILGKSKLIKQIEDELKSYFAGEIKEFKTPLFLYGTFFQKQVWEELRKIPKGKTKSYAEIAQAINKPSAFRAVAMANASNQFAVVIPCHRVINSNGNLGGYGGGIKRKEWLLKHER